jgi:hypothetical protein
VAARLSHHRHVQPEQIVMISIATGTDGLRVPKKRKARPSYAEEANEASDLVREEPADIQRETPDQENAGVEQGKSDQGDTSAFEE